jgi:hypothetical protein
MDRVLRGLLIGCLTSALPVNAIAASDEGQVGLGATTLEWRLPIEFPHVVVPEQLTEDVVQRCLVVADEIDPAYGRRLRQLRIGSAEAFEDQLRQSRRLFELAELKRRDEAQYQLELIQIRADAEVERLSRSYDRAMRIGRVADAQAILAQLRDSVRLQLGLELHDREDYLCRVQEVVDKLQTQFDRDKAQFNTLVELRVERLVKGDPIESDVAARRDQSAQTTSTTSSLVLRPRDHVCPELDEDLIEQFLDLADDIDADLASQLRSLRDRDPAAFADRFCGSRRLYDLTRLRQRDPQLYGRKLLELNLHAQVNRLAEQVAAARREGQSGTVDALRGELHKWVIAEMGLSMLTRQEYLVRLQELVQQLEQQIQQKRGRFDTLVAQRIERIKSEAPPMPPTAASSARPDKLDIPPE